MPARDHLPPMALLAAALVLGGGGSSSPASELALQLFFAAVLLSLAVAGMLRRDRAAEIAGLQLDRKAIALAGLVLILPILQLIPLPPVLWQSLPGRDTERQALTLIGGADSWMPWSQTPGRTFASLLAMIPPAALLLLAAQLDRTGRGWLIATVAAVGLASIVLGALQLADGEGLQWRLYAETHLTYLTGFQANRNAEADILLASLLACAACAAMLLQRERRRARRSIWPALLCLLGAMMVLGTILTGSRMGIALIAIVLPVAVGLVWLGYGGALPRPSILALGAGGLTMLGLALMQLRPVQRVAGRFALDGDGRWMLWEDTRAAIAQVWPAGSGIGSFQPVFLSVEKLEHVDPSMPVRAHNDWLEFTLESGLAGWLVLALVALILASALRQRLAAFGTEPGSAIQAGFGTGVLVVIGMHAMVDYPLRSMALACLSAVAAAMLFDIPGSRPKAFAGSQSKGSS